MYERHHEPLLPRMAFLRRLAQHGGIAFILIAGSLGIGVLGYHLLGGLSWIDSLVNASMILGGMGPVDGLHGNVVKIFAAMYALYSGLIVLIVAGVLFAPIFHRILHHFNLESGNDMT